MIRAETRSFLFARIDQQKWCRNDFRFASTASEYEYLMIQTKSKCTQPKIYYTYVCSYTIMYSWIKVELIYFSNPTSNFDNNQSRFNKLHGTFYMYIYMCMCICRVKTQRKMTTIIIVHTTYIVVIISNLSFEYDHICTHAISPIPLSISFFLLIFARVITYYYFALLGFIKTDKCVPIPVIQFAILRPKKRMEHHAIIFRDFETTAYVKAFHMKKKEKTILCIV